MDRRKSIRCAAVSRVATEREAWSQNDARRFETFPIGSESGRRSHSRKYVRRISETWTLRPVESHADRNRTVQGSVDRGKMSGTFGGGVTDPRRGYRRGPRGLLEILPARDRDPPS